MENLKKVTCVGSGVIGSSWALNFVLKGIMVSIYDVSDTAIESSKDIMEKYLQVLKKHNLIANDLILEERLQYTLDLEEAVEEAQFIQESGPENLEIKKSILRDIESCVRPDIVIASSTSGLLITDIASTMHYPERMIGGHPYNPPHLIPLVEIIKGKSTSEDAVRYAYGFYKKIGKEPVVLNKEVTGFLANRLQAALYREVIHLVTTGVCTIEDVDKAVTYGPGIRWAIMGPNLIFHLGAGKLGLNTLLERQKESLVQRFEDLAKWSEIPQEFLDRAEEGIMEELRHREADKGRSIEDLMEYRDEMLIKILQLHHKI